MLPEISVSLYVRTDFLKFQEMIFKFPRKFVRLDLKSAFPVLENSGSVREGFKNLFTESISKGEGGYGRIPKIEMQKASSMSSALLLFFHQLC